MSIYKNPRYFNANGEPVFRRNADNSDLSAKRREARRWGITGFDKTWTIRDFCEAIEEKQGILRYGS